MKRKITAAVLAVLTVFGCIVPLALLPSADSVASEALVIPERPVCTGSTVIYIAAANTAPDGVVSANTNDGLSIESPKVNWTENDVENGKFGAIPALTEGGTVVVTGKGHIGTGGIIDPQKPVVITAVDPASGRDFRDYNIFKDDTKSHGTQRGAFMAGGDISINGDVIFRDIYFLQRSTKLTTITISDNSKVVIGSSVEFLNMGERVSGCDNYAVNVEAGSYLYLDAAGFSRYSGNGIIVLSKELVEGGKVDVNTFAGFGGNIVFADGTKAFPDAVIPDDTTEPETTPDTDAPDTPDDPDAVTNKFYVSSTPSGDKSGKSPENLAPTSGWDGNGAMYKLLKNGGTVVLVGKCYVNFDNAVLPATDAPVVFTAKDGDTSYIGTVDNDTVSGHGTQTGMFFIKASGKLTFMGDVTFRDCVILDRGKATNRSTISVGNGGRVTIDSSAIIDYTKFSDKTSAHAPKANVEEGGTLVLGTVGFSDYTGKGTIVLTAAVIDGGLAGKSMFTNFEGKVVNEAGEEILATLPDEPTANPGQTPDDPGDTPDTNDPSDTNNSSDTNKTPDTNNSVVTTRPKDEYNANDTYTFTANNEKPSDTTQASAEPASNGIPVVVICVAAGVVIACAVVVVVIATKKKKEKAE